MGYLWYPWRCRRRVNLEFLDLPNQFPQINETRLFLRVKTDLAETCAVAEQYVGTIGGGMDQAISCLAESGAALLIDFNPLKARKIILPENSMFVITNSCVEANKAATNQFNTRVVECRIAAQVIKP